MTDRELLELAAKAAGQQLADPLDSHIPSGGLWIVGRKGMDEVWNPRNADGHAARLAARLSMEVSFRGEGDERVVQVNDTIMFVNSDLAGGNEMKAYREAVVSVAAEIGRSMP